ncbi:MAG: hypothetical protein ACI4JV_09795 [Ruminiclostridium sp.]
MSKVINRAECESIEFLAEQKIRPERIASIIGCSLTTVKRVMRGEHHIVKERKCEEERNKARIQAEAEAMLMPETKDYFEFRVDEKLNKIIELLEKLCGKAGI